MALREYLVCDDAEITGGEVQACTENQWRRCLPYLIDEWGSGDLEQIIGRCTRIMASGPDDAIRRFEMR